MSSMPYTVALRPIQTNYDPTLKIYCPRCKSDQQLDKIVDMVNAYGCIDGTVQIFLRCGHSLMPWEREEKPK